jgi:ribosome-associated toxin RatA of RatAB toxin-antitoxin module
MRRTQATDCRTLPFDLDVVFAALLDCENYPRWWPANLRVRVIQITQSGLGSRIEIWPRGGRFICEISLVVPTREILIEYIEGVYRDTGRWTFEKLAEETRVCYQINLEPQGWLPRILSNCMDFGTMHSHLMEKVIDGLVSWLTVRRSSAERPKP